MKRAACYASIVILTIVAILITRQIVATRQSSITILWHGVPAAGWTVTDVQTMKIRVTDANGTIAREGDRSLQHAVFFPRPDGGSSFLQFPTHGNRTIDLHGRFSTSTHRRMQWGCVWVIEEQTQTNLTDEEIAQIETGRSTLEKIQSQIRDQP